MNAMPRHTLRALRLGVLLLFGSTLLSRCATMMTPTGGPKDTLPPVILTMTPDNYTRNVPTVPKGMKSTSASTSSSKSRTSRRSSSPRRR